MTKLNLPSHLTDKIFEIRLESDETVSNIVSYFPFTELEKQEILSILNKEYFGGFHSIFTDTVTEEEWNKTKEQIKKKFKDELFDVDKMLQS
jgi:lipoate-protein ligase A